MNPAQILRNLPGTLAPLRQFHEKSRRRTRALAERILFQDLYKVMESAVGSCRGGRVLAFNVDPQFSNVLDGLIVVDLLETERALLDRYLGKDGAEEFLACHRAAAPARLAC